VTLETAYIHGLLDTSDGRLISIGVYSDESPSLFGLSHRYVRLDAYVAPTYDEAARMADRVMMKSPVYAWSRRLFPKRAVYGTKWDR
jgi:hypothetical protein